MSRLQGRPKRMTRLERMTDNKARMEYYQQGKGSYVFRNHRPSSLSLPKPAKLVTGETTKEIQGGQEFIGDDYFMSLVRTNEVRLVRTLEEPKKTEAPQPEVLKEAVEAQPAKPAVGKEENMNEEKLIVDQPDRVTNEGTVEQVRKPGQDKGVKLNEGQPQTDQGNDVLLNDSPIDGVEILG
jgi:hypothetical protein